MSQALDLLRQLVALHNPKVYAEPAVQRTWEAARQLAASHDAPDCTEPAQVEREQESRTDTAGMENVQENEGESEKKWMEWCDKVSRIEVEQEPPARVWPELRVGDRVRRGPDWVALNDLERRSSGYGEIIRYRVRANELGGPLYFVRWDGSAQEPRGNRYHDDCHEIELAEPADAEPEPTSDPSGCFTRPIAEIDQELHDAGGDPAAIGERGAAAVRDILRRGYQESEVERLKGELAEYQDAHQQEKETSAYWLREAERARAEVERLTAKLNATATTASYGYAGPSPVLDALRDSLEVTARARLKYGTDYQLLVAIGEAGEFIDAASRYVRAPDDIDDETDFLLLDETADLLIVGTSTSRLFDPARLAEHIRAKVARLAERLDGGK